MLSRMRLERCVFKAYDIYCADFATFLRRIAEYEPRPMQLGKRAVSALQSRHIASWMRRGGLAVLDQALYSGANFLINVLLARWLSSTDFGAFTLVLSVSFLLSTLHSSILAEPMLVFGASKYAGRFQAYLGILLYGHFIIALIFSLITAIVAFVVFIMGLSTLARSFTALVIAAPWILLLFLVRRIFYVALNPLWSAVGSTIYFFLMIIGVCILNQTGAVRGDSSILVMGFSGAVTSLFLLLIIKPRIGKGSMKGFWREVMADHWGYSKWAIGSSLLSSSYGTIYYALITVFLGLDSVAILKAVQNLFAPLSQFIHSITSLLIPWSARRYMTMGSKHLTVAATRVSLLLTIGAFFYVLLMVTAGPSIADILYAGKYTGYSWLIILMGMINLVTAMGGGSLVALQASARSDLVFVVAITGSFVSLAGNLILVSSLGFRGAALGFGLFSVSASILAWWLWLVKGRRRNSQIAPGKVIL